LEDAEAYFDNLWEEAVPITEDKSRRTQLVNAIERETHIRQLSPFEAFLLVLKTYLDSFSQKQIGPGLVELMKKNGYTPYTYQIDAVKQALAVIEQYGGVVIADVVGLGKSVVASMIGHELKKRGLILAPPGLVGDRNKTYGWKMYAEQFGLHDWEVRSRGDIEAIAENIERLNDIEVVVIDEAHRYRNQDTRGYECLKNICRGKIVILLTATPFNNRPSDILSLLELFTVPKKSNITLDGDLKNKFRIFGGMFDRLSYILKNYNSPKTNNRQKAQDFYNAIFGEGAIDTNQVRARVKYLASEIRNVIEPVTIRRNRLDLLNHPEYSKELGDLSKVKNPQEWFFTLTREQSELYDEVLKVYFADPEAGGRFTGAIYRPFMYENPPEGIDEESAKAQEITFIYTQQHNLYEFIRRMLVKRFESSFGSFVSSLHNIRRVTKTVLDFVEKTNKYVLDRNLVEKIAEWDVDEIEAELIKYAQRLDSTLVSKKDQVYEVDKFIYKETFLEDIKKDIAMFDELIKKFEKLRLVENDPKVASLINHLQEAFGKDKERKIIVFSEYADTIQHLVGPISDQFGERVLVVQGELGTTKAQQINKNFDASYQNKSDEFDILLTTDKVSEGFNLNRAGLVVNYDIPWNPVRVIQRVGRINRIGHKVFDSLFIANFFPTEQGSSIVQSRMIAQNKMFLIHNTLGEDAKIFESDETPQPAKLFERIQQNPDDLESESFYTKAVKLFEDYSKEHPEIIVELDKFPKRVKVSKQADTSELFIFIRKGRLFVRAVKADKQGKFEIRSESVETVFDQIKVDFKTKSVDKSEFFWEWYIAAKEYREDRPTPLSQNSIEIRALNNIRSMIQQSWEELLPQLKFLQLLKKDIVDYGTLPEYTLRRLSALKTNGQTEKAHTVKELIDIKTELGNDYEQTLMDSPTQANKEIIIAIENRK